MAEAGGGFEIGRAENLIKVNGVAQFCYIQHRASDDLKKKVGDVHPLLTINFNPSHRYRVIIGKLKKDSDTVDKSRIFMMEGKGVPWDFTANIYGNTPVKVIYNGRYLLAEVTKDLEDGMFDIRYKDVQEEDLEKARTVVQEFVKGIQVSIRNIIISETDLKKDEKMQTMSKSLKVFCEVVPEIKGPSPSSTPERKGGDSFCWITDKKTATCTVKVAYMMDKLIDTIALTPPTVVELPPTVVEFFTFLESLEQSVTVLKIEGQSKIKMAKRLQKQLRDVIEGAGAKTFTENWYWPDWVKINNPNQNRSNLPSSVAEITFYGPRSNVKMASTESITWVTDNLTSLEFKVTEKALLKCNQFHKLLKEKGEEKSGEIGLIPKVNISVVVEKSPLNVAVIVAVNVTITPKNQEIYDSLQKYIKNFKETKVNFPDTIYYDKKTNTMNKKNEVIVSNLEEFGIGVNLVNVNPNQRIGTICLAGDR